MSLRGLLLTAGFVAATALAFVLGRGSLPGATAPTVNAASVPARTTATSSTPAPATTASLAVRSSATDAPPTSLPGLFGFGGLFPATTTSDADTDASTLPDIAAIASYEDLMYAQPDMVDAAVAKLRASTPGSPGLYAIGFAGDAEENVFRNEVAYLPKLLAQRFDAEGRTLQLINSPYTFVRTPLATRSNLDQALIAMARRMDPANDILLLFLTSHGSHDHQLLVEMGSLPLDQLSPQDIRAALDRAKIRWRVIVISACYSGGFVPALREPHTLVITAARTDRTSFGCGSDSQLTWFGKAFLVDALNRSTDFRTAFDDATTQIAQWERREHETPSEPQLWEGPLIAAKLAQWRASLPAHAATVPFAPTPQRLAR